MPIKNQNHIYIYDEKHQQVIIIDGETGEQIPQKEDRVTSVLSYLNEQNETGKLRKFVVWCAHRTNEHIKPIQNKFMELAEQAIQGEADAEQLKELYDKTEGVAVATDSVGLRQGSEKAPAFLATRECVNPDAFEGALQAARFHRLWAEMRERDGQKNPGEIEINATAHLGEETEQEQIDYLLDLML